MTGSLGKVAVGENTANDLAIDLSSAALGERLRSWLAVGIQAPSGAFYAWIDHQTGEPSFEYPEITGYALTHIASSPLGDDLSSEEMEAGLRAAAWLERYVNSSCAARAGWDYDAVYNFDLAMIANGLMTFGTRAGDNELVRCGVEVARRLSEQISSKEGLGSIDLSRSIPSQRSTWSTVGFAHLMKVAQCLLTAADLGMMSGVTAATSVIARGLQGQRPDGSIETQPNEPLTMLHPLLYAVEGLWVYGASRGNNEALDSAYRAVTWMSQHILPSGGLPRYVNAMTGEIGPEQFDVTSQFLRAALLLEMPLDLAPTAKRLSEASLSVFGLGEAMPYQWRPVQHRNAWVSMFASQACALLAGPNASKLEWRYLV